MRLAQPPFASFSSPSYRRRETFPTSSRTGGLLSNYWLALTLQLRGRQQVQRKICRVAKLKGVEASREAERQLIVRRADEIAARAVEWLWPGRIARGKLTLFGGDPGLGKSQVLLSVASAFSTAGYWPCHEGRAPLGYVIILSAEDGEDDTIKPRLMAAGANCSKIHIVSAVRDGSDHKMFNLQRDLDLLESLILTLGKSVAAVIIDPLTAYLGRVDFHKSAEMRAVLGPIAEMAARLNVGFIGNTHLTKSIEHGKALYRFIGSIATVAAARAAFAIVEDRDDPARRLLLHAKNNLAPEQAGLAFRPSGACAREGQHHGDLRLDSKPWLDGSFVSGKHRKRSGRSGPTLIVPARGSGTLKACRRRSIDCPK